MQGPFVDPDMQRAFDCSITLVMPSSLLEPGRVKEKDVGSGRKLKKMPKEVDSIEGEGLALENTHGCSQVKAVSILGFVFSTCSKGFSCSCTNFKGVKSDVEKQPHYS